MGNSSVINNGLINAGLTAVYFGSTGTFLQSSTGSIISANYGVSVDSGPVTGNNFGLISTRGRGLGGTGYLTFTNETGATIISSNNDAVRFETGSTGNLTNNGTITGSTSASGTAGVKYDTGGRGGALINTGTITGVRGVIVRTNNTTIDNSGTITGNTEGVYISTSGVVTSFLNQAGATITGGTYSINNLGTISNGIDNYGVLQGNVQLTGAALNLLGTSSAVNGTVTGNTSSAINVGSASQTGEFTVNYTADVGTISVASGSALTLADGINWTASVASDAAISMPEPPSLAMAAVSLATPAMPAC
ncbi:hypothetical protein HED55_23195 [Ochrobactrum haematophilum]|uniref:Outer membrane autotransporter n=1 Tax=Brucella haematophila TaxID=419474 RepID=A0ABX1DTW6_9HYPH|nr:hypothetical protein [Brucella haematophila]